MISRRLLAAASAAVLGSAASARFLPALAQAAPELIAPPPAPVPGAGKPMPLAGKDAMARAQQVLAAELITALAGKAASQNIILSPMSVTAALAIIAMGGDASLLHSMRQTLQMPGKGGDMAAFTNALTALAAYGKDGAKSPLAQASLLVLDPALQPNAATLGKLHEFDVEVGRDNLADPVAIARINDWVKDKTHDLIPSILDQPPGAGSLVALNALYFKDKWLSPFDAARTVPLPFTGTDGKAAPVPMMAQDGSFAFRTEGNLIGIDLGFADPRFGLVLVTTKAKPESAAMLTKAAHGWLGGAKFTESAGSVTMPRLRLEGSNDLLAVLRQLGLKDGPNSLQSFGTKPPQISAITQKTVLKLDEEGAEAAAATAIIATRSVSGVQTHLVLDKPYLFALRDKSNGFMVVAGYVARPEEGQA